MTTLAEPTSSLSSRLATLFAESTRAVIHGFAWAVLVGTIAPPPALAAAAVGGFLGDLTGARLARSGFRTSVIVVGSLVAFSLSVLLRTEIVGSSAFVSMLGPHAAVRVSAVFISLLVPYVVSLLLRALSRRRAVFGVFELLLVAVAFAQLFVAHRHGAINRPFYLADWIIALGWDPMWLFLFVGGTASVFGFVLLMREQRFGRAVLNLGVVGLLLGLVVLVTPMVGMPSPPDGGAGLGLRPEESEGQEQKEAQGQQRKGPTNGELEFRDDYDSGGSRVPVAVVLFHDDYSPPSGVYYFRQGAFSQYNGRKMVASGGLAADRDLIAGFPSRPTQIPGAPELNENRGPLETTVALMADHTQPFALEAPIEVEPLDNPDPNRFRRVYRATSGVLTADYDAMFGSPIGSPDWSEEQWAHYTEAPADPRYDELAAEITAELPKGLIDSPAARAFSVASWLSKEGIYSLKNAHGDSDDPTASFLFGDLTGYCVHFSHAAAYLMRSMGIPARVATGYAVAESARQGGSSLLLSGAASHAWPEVYVDGFGWVVMDVYPERALDAPEPPMDPDLQRLLGELARGASPLPLSATNIPKIQELARKLSLTIGTWLALLLGGLVLLLYLVKAWRRLAPRWASEKALPRVAYRAELDRIGEVSVRRQPGESRESFSRRVGDSVPGFEPLTRAHIASTYGSQPAEPSAVRTHASAVRREIRERFPLWKRLFGAVTPWSWLRSK